jgi:hypothetical protein
VEEGGGRTFLPVAAGRSGGCYETGVCVD